MRSQRHLGCQDEGQWSRSIGFSCEARGKLTGKRTTTPLVSIATETCCRSARDMKGVDSDTLRLGGAK